MSIKNEYFKFLKSAYFKKVGLFLGVFLFFHSFCEEALSKTHKAEAITSIFKKVSLPLILSSGSYSFSVSEEKTSSSSRKQYRGLLKQLTKSKGERKNFKKKKKKLAATSVRSKRQPANTTYDSCSDSETFQDKYSASYIRLGYSCDPEEELCIASYDILRNECDEEDALLVHYYCDPKVESLFSSKKIKCPKGCHFSGLSGRCIE